MNGKIDFEEELAKIILANCLNGPFIRSGIRKKDGKLVVISSVKKNGENFYIPVSVIQEYLKAKYHENKNFIDKNDIKKSFEKLLFDLYNEKGARFLGVDGLCAYLGERIKKLPTFSLGQGTFEDQQFKNALLITDPKVVSKIDKFLNDGFFKSVDIKFDNSYEVDEYPISIEEQKNRFSKW